MLGYRLSFLAETCDYRRLALGTKKEAEWIYPENPDVTRLVETTRKRRQDISLLDGLSRENFDSTPETWGVGLGHLEVSETLAPDLSRFCMRVLDGEEYNFFQLDEAVGAVFDKRIMGLVAASPEFSIALTRRNQDTAILCESPFASLQPRYANLLKDLGHAH